VILSNVQYKNILAMIFNETKCHVNTSLGLVGDASPCVSAWLWSEQIDEMFTQKSGSNPMC